MSDDDAGRFTLAVLGATGGTGRLVVEGALREGWRVRVLARNRALVPLGWKVEGVIVVEGDATDPEAVARVVHGADGVVSTLGHAPRAPTNVLAVSARLVTAAMRDAGVDRLVVMTGAGVPGPGDRPGLVGRFMSALLARLHADVWADAVAQADVVKESGLAWTIVRATRLTDKPGKGNARVGPLAPGVKPFVSRADVARFIVHEVRAREHVHAMPAVTSA